ncbi:MAG: LysM peptidoglycan-binding domain-containing protein [Syntrophomonadaceae bacterium]|jgi:peptidoglycan endopeptidase LytE|nr:LysM peptidoglycan-binding domain-containing protein [Syntrophomonadaceae bacterium]
MLKKIVLVISIIFIFQLAFTGSAVAAETYHIVKSGDTLWGIARQYDTNVEQIKQLNQINSDNIKIGLKLCVKITPDQAPVVQIAESAAEDTALIDSAEQVYIVQPGDSLNSIAQKYGTSVEMLKRINNLTSEVLNPGYILKLNMPGADVSRGGNVDRVAAAVLATAKQHLGTPYRYGGSSPGGFDCSGFVKYVFSQHGYNLNRTAAAQCGQGAAVSKSDLQLGDLVFFKCSSSSIDHVGIYSGNNEFIHSSSPRSGGVIITNLDESYYARSYAGAARIIQ